MRSIIRTVATIGLFSVLLTTSCSKKNDPAKDAENASDKGTESVGTSGTIVRIDRTKPQSVISISGSFIRRLVQQELDRKARRSNGNERSDFETLLQQSIVATGVESIDAYLFFSLKGQDFDGAISVKGPRLGSFVDFAVTQKLLEKKSNDVWVLADSIATEDPSGLLAKYQLHKISSDHFIVVQTGFFDTLDIDKIKHSDIMMRHTARFGVPHHVMATIDVPPEISDWTQHMDAICKTMTGERLEFVEEFAEEFGDLTTSISRFTNVSIGVSVDETEKISSDVYVDFAEARECKRVFDVFENPAVKTPLGPFEDARLQLAEEKIDFEANMDGSVFHFKASQVSMDIADVLEEFVDGMVSASRSTEPIVDWKSTPQYAAPFVEKKPYEKYETIEKSIPEALLQSIYPIIDGNNLDLYFEPFAIPVLSEPCCVFISAVNAEGKTIDLKKWWDDIDLAGEKVSLPSDINSLSELPKTINLQIELSVPMGYAFFELTKDDIGAVKSSGLGYFRLDTLEGNGVELSLRCRGRVRVHAFDSTGGTLEQTETSKERTKYHYGRDSSGSYRFKGNVQRVLVEVLDNSSYKNYHDVTVDGAELMKRRMPNEPTMKVPTRYVSSSHYGTPYDTISQKKFKAVWNPTEYKIEVPHEKALLEDGGCWSILGWKDGKVLPLRGHDDDGLHGWEFQLKNKRDLDTLKELEAVTGAFTASVPERVLRFTLSSPEDGGKAEYKLSPTERVEAVFDKNTITYKHVKNGKAVPEEDALEPSRCVVYNAEGRVIRGDRLWRFTGTHRYWGQPRRIECNVPVGSRTIALPISFALKNTSASQLENYQSLHKNAAIAFSLGGKIRKKLCTWNNSGYIDDIAHLHFLAKFAEFKEGSIIRELAIADEQGNKTFKYRVSPFCGYTIRVVNQYTDLFNHTISPEYAKTPKTFSWNGGTVSLNHAEKKYDPLILFRPKRVGLPTIIYDGSTYFTPDVVDPDRINIKKQEWTSVYADDRLDEYFAVPDIDPK